RAVVRFNDRPFFITEYGIPYWHRYRHEEGLLFPALAALQNIQAIAVHAQAVILEHRMHMEDFSVGRDPINRANQVLAGLLYGRGDVAPSKHRVDIVFDDAWVFRGNNAFKSVDSGLSRMALVTGVGLRYEGHPAPPGIPPAPPADLSLQTSSGGEVIATEWTAATVDTVKPDTATRAMASLRVKGILPPENVTDPARGIYQSDTGEILLESEIERMSVATPRSCGVAIKPGVEGSAGAIVSARSDVAALVGVGALDDQPLSDSRRILVVYATDAVNSGHETSEDRVVLRKLGTLPILVETGTLSLRIRNQNAASLRGYALGMNGTRREEVTLTAGEGILSLEINTADLKSGPALFFELFQPDP
ncbi:MAG: hypothetical protein U1E27_01770, partial [Kiritimatiellia bacterium]|nr:hypothetical protein [Kiritimatiellia bacterium]